MLWVGVSNIAAATNEIAAWNSMLRMPLSFGRTFIRGRIVSVNPRDAKEFANEACFSIASQTIDAVQTLAYDAARHNFVAAKVLRGLRAYEVSNSLFGFLIGVAASWPFRSAARPDGRCGIASSTALQTGGQ